MDMLPPSNEIHLLHIQTESSKQMHLTSNYNFV